MQVSIKVFSNIDTTTICRKYGLGSSNAARKSLAANVRRRCDKYVPKDQGNLKNTFQIAPDGSTITYMMPYARKQYTTPYRHSDPRRCQYWDRAMMAAEGDAVARELEAYIKGRPGK